MSDFLTPPLIPTDIEAIAEAELSNTTAATAAPEASHDEATAATAAPEPSRDEAAAATAAPKDSHDEATDATAAPEPSHDEAPAEEPTPAAKASADADAPDQDKATATTNAAEGTAADADIPDDMTPLPSEEAIREALHVVTDPEIGISIMELGLVYDVIRDEAQHTVTINMTLTSPGCPLGPEMTSAVYLTVTRMPGVRDCHVELVWSPMWDPQVNATEETRIALGLW